MSVFDHTVFDSTRHAPPLRSPSVRAGVAPGRLAGWQARAGPEEHAARPNRSRIGSGGSGGRTRHAATGTSGGRVAVCAVGLLP